MGVSESWADQALKKLDAEKSKVAGNHANLMKNEVLYAMKVFCQQNEEFAQAVVQGGSFQDCMKKVAASVGNCIPDREAYKRAVQFYFPGAQVVVELTIDLIGDAAEQIRPAKPVAAPSQQKAKIISLDLADFF